MIEFLQECVMPVNLPMTVLLGLVLAYWLLIIVGVLGMDAFDLDLDLNADVDLDVDAGVDTDVHGSLFAGALKFLHLGDVPVMIVVSIFVFAMWFFTVVSNHYLNADARWGISVLWMVPNLIVSLLLTKVILLPLVSVFKHVETPPVNFENMIGLKGVVKTSQVTEKFGQVEIRIDGPPLVINARTTGKRNLAKGDLAKIVAYNKGSDTFTVELSKWEKE